MAHQIWFWAKPCRGRLVSPVSLASRIRSSQRARRRCRSSRSASWPVRVGGERGDPVPVDVGDGQLGAGVGPFFADDDPHAGRPAGEVEQAGEFGDPGAVAGHPVGVIGRGPHRGGDLLDQCRGVAGQGEPDRVLDSLAGQPFHQLVAVSGTINPDQQPFPGSRVGHLGQLVERFPQHGDVVGGRVRAGVARSKQDRQRFPGAYLAMVDEDTQRVAPVALLEGRLGVLLVRVCGHQSGIHVDRQRLPNGHAVAGGMSASKLPGAGAGIGAGRVDGPQHRRSLTCQQADQPGKWSGRTPPGRTRQAPSAAGRHRPSSHHPTRD